MANSTNHPKRGFPWQVLAHKHNLSFVLGDFKYGQVTGDYQDHQLTLSYAMGHTHILLFANHSSRNHRHTKNKILESVGLTTENILNHLAPPAVLEKLKGQISAGIGGQTIAYKQRGFEDNLEYLQLVFDLVCNLASAYLLIERNGSKTIPVLSSIVTNPRHKLREFVIPLLRDIAEETRITLVGLGKYSLCPSCLVYCGANTIQLAPLDAITYYGCRVCGQSDHFKTWKGRIVAILHNQMKKEKYVRNGVLYVNWLARRDLFDFDSIRIVQATDEDVERFAVLVGNDTDEERKPRYSQMSCFVSPKCRLSPNTIRILRHIFGQITTDKA